MISRSIAAIAAAILFTAHAASDGQPPRLAAAPWLNGALRIAEQPALPPGHPPVPSMQLPPGHPPIGEAHPGLPEGHPPLHGGGCPGGSAPWDGDRDVDAFGESDEDSATLSI